MGTMQAIKRTIGSRLKDVAQGDERTAIQGLVDSAEQLLDSSRSLPNLEQALKLYESAKKRLDVALDPSAEPEPEQEAKSEHEFAVGMAVALTDRSAVVGTVMKREGRRVRVNFGKEKLWKLVDELQPSETEPAEPGPDTEADDQGEPQTALAPKGAVVGLGCVRIRLWKG